MIAFSAAWSAAVAKLARPRLCVTISVSPTTMALPTARAVSAARRANSAYRARLRELGFASGIGRAEYSAALREIALVLIRGRADEEHRHLTDIGVGANAIEYLEAVESRHHDVEDEKVGVDLTHGLEHQRAIRHHDGLVGVLVVDRVAEQGRDRFVIFADDDDLLFDVSGHLLHAAIYRRSCSQAKVR